mmetsp:Transcript_70169/g.210872  ORF Transcript_70169/g.210872 Transcript_70169/m.210872 type:complete len:140 (+) Transcript_70169:269-688(+)
MGFGSRGKKASPAPAPPARPASSMAAPPQSMPPPQAAAPPQAMPAPAAGPSMMGTFGSSMAGSVAGSMLGNAISSSMSGGRSEAPAVQPAAPAAPAAPATAMCTFESRQFLECMTNTGEQLEQCRGFYDAFKMCQAQAQ